MTKSAAFCVLSSIALFLFVTDTFAAAPYVVEYEQDIKTVWREYLSRPRESHKTEKRKLTSFKWSNCGGIDEKVTLLSLLPDPVHLPGTLNITAVFDILHDINAPISAQVNISKETEGIWIPLPCMGNIGSCNYPDICSLLKPLVCPDEIKNCHCPFLKGHHTIKYPNADINAVVLPSGQYQATGILSDKNGKRLGCLSIQLSIE